MTMTVFLEVQIRNDVAADTVEAAIRETLAQTAARQGNESLEVLVDDEDPTRMVVLERWATAEDHDAYVAWRATPRGRGGGARRSARRPAGHEDLRSDHPVALTLVAVRQDQRAACSRASMASHAKLANQCVE
ncbi:antibiotic biosynthesis monooxygenase family protein [Curtobacterium sp. MCJR17_043]|uniref:putative quinol monooxygenase n=1 Tax=Curtobacterium sp. MCJR17_043 TaxID=2175660 RepID=UPI0024E00B9E|nr:antibiotic biosynthesis monooxygenase family protein [Curtobacterium sp. MCJR17_043]WIB35666.1 antibiotic biosynthesis monooxygenase family protein [Curtobacterium sp. MCJR17_043]